MMTTLEGNDQGTTAARTSPLVQPRARSWARPLMTPPQHALVGTAGNYGTADILRVVEGTDPTTQIRLVVDNAGRVGMGTTTPSQILSVQGNVLISGDLTSLANLTATGTLTQNAFAYTALTASTEKSDVNLNLARTVQFSAGNLATQRAVLIQAPTYSFTASSTLTDASTLLITGAPVAGVYTTSTNNYGLKIDAGSVRGTGAIAPDNAYGLYVSAPAVATNNYGAVFASGNVGIGTASPADKFTVSSGHITATNNSSSSTLQEDALIVNQTVGTYDLGRFYVDASGKVSASVSLLTYGNVTSTGNLYALSGSASTSILNGSSLTLGQGLLQQWDI